MSASSPDPSVRLDGVRRAGLLVDAIAMIQFDVGRSQLIALFDALGVTPQYGYFLLRSAPMRRPAPDLVGAAMPFFPPIMVAKLVGRMWAMVDADTVLARGVAALSEAAVDALGEEAPVPELAELLGEAARSASTDGRALAAAWQTVDWPDHPAARLLGAATTLREHRGDGHIFALAAHGLTPLQGHMLASARRGADPVRASSDRGWRPEQLEPALDDLQGRDALTERGLSSAGEALWESVELLTDRLASQPWDVLGDRLDRTLELAGAVTIR